MILVFIAVFIFKLLIAVTPQITDTADEVHKRRNPSPTEKNIYHTKKSLPGIKIIDSYPTEEPSKKESNKSIFHKKQF